MPSTVSPLLQSPVAESDRARGDGDLLADFIEQTCKVTKDSYAAPVGGLLELRDWQRELLRAVFARRPDGRYQHRQGLIGMPRKNAKSTLSAGVALGGLLLGSGGNEVYSCAGDREQARIVFGTAKRMVELDAELSSTLRTYRDAIEYPALGSVYRVLSAEAYSKEGLNPNLVIFDEVHVQPDRELWDVMALASGARRDPLLLGITTAGVRSDASGRHSLCYELYRHGVDVAQGLVVDPGFFFAWWGAPDGADYRDPEVWRMANPGFGDIIDPEDFDSAVLRTPENEFRTKRLNQWVASAQAWLPAGCWDACADPRLLVDGERVVLAFDGSFNNDSTALVAVTCGEVPHIDVVAAWERPDAVGSEWQVPILDVEEAILAACRRFDVREICADPFRWARTYQVLEAEGLPLVEFPQNQTRMTPATTRFYEAVVNGAVTHSGDPRLARHVGNAVLKTDSRGSRLSKDAKNSNRKIDLAVAAVMGLDRAAWHAANADAGVSVYEGRGLVTL